MGGPQTRFMDRLRQLFEALGFSAATRQPAWWHRLIRGIASTAVGAWVSAPTLHHLDRIIMRLFGRRASLTRLFAGVETVWLTTTGAKSGLPRTVPLLGIEEGEKIILIASNWGQGHHPVWYRNVRAHPEVTVSVRGREAVYVAREAPEAEREEYWEKVVVYYPGYAAYQRRVRGRQIPVIILTPKRP